MADTILPPGKYGLHKSRPISHCKSYNNHVSTTEEAHESKQAQAMLLESSDDSDLSIHTPPRQDRVIAFPKHVSTPISTRRLLSAAETSLISQPPSPIASDVSADSHANILSSLENLTDKLTTSQREDRSDLRQCLSRINEQLDQHALLFRNIQQHNTPQTYTSRTSRVRVPLELSVCTTVLHLHVNNTVIQIFI